MAAAAIDQKIDLALEALKDAAHEAKVAELEVKVEALMQHQREAKVAELEDKVEAIMQHHVKKQDVQKKKVRPRHNAPVTSPWAHAPRSRLAQYSRASPSPPPPPPSCHCPHSNTYPCMKNEWNGVDYCCVSEYEEDLCSNVP